MGDGEWVVVRALKMYLAVQVTPYVLLRSQAAASQISSTLKIPQHLLIKTSDGKSICRTNKYEVEVQPDTRPLNQSAGPIKRTDTQADKQQADIQTER